MPSENREWKLKELHSFDGLKLQDAEKPSPVGTEILIKMKAASLNYRDVAMVFEEYPSPIKDDLTTLSDGAGEVVAVGDHSTRFKVGDKVMPICTPGWITGAYPGLPGIGNALDGVLRDYMIAEEQNVVLMPSNLNFAEAATLPCAAVTSWNALYGLKRLQPGDWVLTEGTGGCSLFAIQFAKAAGARVVATTSSDDKAQILRDLGANHVINYKTDSNWGETARNLTSCGFDHVIDVGGASTLPQAVKAVAKDGVISLIGFLGKGESPDLMATLYNGFIARGISIGSRVQFEEMNRAIEATGIKPIVDKVFKFEDTAEAYKLLQGQSFTGKVVIEI